jgi:hypothetical protein
MRGRVSPNSQRRRRPMRLPFPTRQSRAHTHRGCFYEELSETDLTFSVQATIHSASEARRPDFIIYMRCVRVR